jgi:hypothetical protein
MSCPRQITAEVLADYWLGQIPKGEEESLEEHFFGCSDCERRLQEVVELAQGLKRLARSGALTMIVDDAYLRTAAEQGLTVREYALGPNQSVNCTITSEDDFLVARMTADLIGSARVDLSICIPGGVEINRHTNIPFNAEAGQVLWQQSAVYAKGAGDGILIARLLATDEAGAERLIGEYTFNHTRTIPGPPAW